MKNKALIIVAMLGLMACSEQEQIQEPTMNGLWDIKKVSIDGKEKTPDGRWARFNEDSTYEAGNGWQQHTIGNWKLQDKELFLHQANGWKDEYENFKVELNGDQMTWTRTEDGLPVIVSLEKVNKIPTRQADMVYGVWELVNTTVNGEQVQTEGRNTIFFRWDKIFIAQNENNRSFGLFKTQGHEQEIELVYYNESCTREYWNFSVENNVLKLEAINTEDKSVQTYMRIYDLN